ncbi:LamG domain-containing protein, partial [Bacteroidota bacterium]
MKQAIIYILVIFTITISSVSAQNNALDFDGTDDYVEVAYNAALNPTDFTVEAWVKTNNASATQSVFSSREEFKGYTMYLSGGDVVFQTGNGLSWDDLAAGYTVTTDWTHIALVYTASSTTKTIYINGVEKTSTTDKTYSKNETYRQLIGAGEPESVGQDFYFNGVIDELRIWDDIRTVTEIRANMYQELTTTTNLVAYYKLNSSSGTTAIDSKGSNTGTLDGSMTDTDWVTSSAFFGPKNCIDFNTNDHVSLPFVIGTTSVSIECWVKLNTISDHGAFIHIGNTDTGFGIGVGGASWDNSGNELIVLYDTKDWYLTGENLGTNWHHVALVLDANSKPIVYLDGEEVYSNSEALVPLSPTGISSIAASVRANSNVHRHLTRGIIDEVRIWSDVRTESEIRENMCKTLIGNETNLAGYYNLDDTGNTIIDNTGN